MIAGVLFVEAGGVLDEEFDTEVDGGSGEG